jgi:chromate transporter
MFFISAFTFGGGYVVVPMIQQYFVKENKLLKNQEVLDMAAIAQSSPGAIAVNLSVLTGYHLKGLKGAFVAAVATLLPPLLLLSVISMFYVSFRQNMLIAAVLKGMEAAVVAMIIDFIINMTQTITQEKNWFFMAWIPLSFVANYFFHVSVIWILLVCIATSIGYALYKK